MKPAQIPKTKYKEPISLWLVETNQRRGEERERKGEIKLRPEKRIEHPPSKDYKIGSLMNYIILRVQKQERGANKMTYDTLKRAYLVLVSLLLIKLSRIS